MANESDKLRIVGVYNPQKGNDEEFPLMSYLMKVGMEAAYNSEDDEEDKEEARRLRRQRQMTAHNSRLTALDRLRNMEWKRNIQEDKERFKLQQAEKKKREEEVYFKGTREAKNKNRKKSRQNQATPPVVIGLSSAAIAVPLSVEAPSFRKKNLSFDLPPPPPATNAWQKKSGTQLFKQAVNNDDDIEKAISASLETYQQEQEKQKRRYPNETRDTVKNSGDIETKLVQNNNTLDSIPCRPVISFNSPSIEVKKQEGPEQTIMGRQRNISESEEEEEYDDEMSDWGSDTDKEDDTNQNSNRNPAHHGSHQNGTRQDVGANTDHNRNSTYQGDNQPRSDNVSLGYEHQNSRYSSYRPSFGDVSTLSEKRMYQYSFQRRTNLNPQYDSGRHTRSQETTNRQGFYQPNEICPYLTANSNEDWETRSNTEFLNENWEDSADELDENTDQIEDAEYEISDNKLTCVVVNEDILSTDTLNSESKIVNSINQNETESSVTSPNHPYMNDENSLESRNALYTDFSDDEENKVDSDDDENKIYNIGSANNNLLTEEDSKHSIFEESTVESATVTPLQVTTQSGSSSTATSVPSSLSSNSTPTFSNPINDQAFFEAYYRQQVENICRVMQQLQLYEQQKQSTAQQIPNTTPSGNNNLLNANPGLSQNVTTSVGPFGLQPLPPNLLGVNMFPFAPFPPGFGFPTTLQHQPGSQSVPTSHIPLQQASQPLQSSPPVNDGLIFSGNAASNPIMPNIVSIQQGTCSKSEVTTQAQTHSKTNLPTTPQVSHQLNFPNILSLPDLSFLNPNLLNSRSPMFPPGLGFPLQQLPANTSAAPTIPLHQSSVNAPIVPSTHQGLPSQIRNNPHLPQQLNSVDNAFVQGKDGNLKPENASSGTQVQQAPASASGFNTIQFPRYMSSLPTNLGQMQLPAFVPGLQQANLNSREPLVSPDIPSRQTVTSGTTSVPSFPNYPIHPSMLGMGMMPPFGLTPQMSPQLPNPLVLGMQANMQQQHITMDQLRDALPNANMLLGPSMAGVSNSSSNQTMEPRGRGRLNAKDYK